MTRQLVFVHGRAQQGLNPDDSKAEWLDAFRAGLAKNGLELPIPETAVRFPYYGDALFDLVQGRTGADVAEVVVRGDSQDAEQEAFLLEVFDEVRRAKGIDEADLAQVAAEEVITKGPLNWEWTQAVLTFIDRRVPGGSGLTLALVTNDVYQYLVAQSIKGEIDEGVSAALSRDVESVVVGHSLGTVVAYNVLRERGEQEGWTVPLFVTLGSPLGVSRIRREIVPPRWPACVRTWFNAMDDRDVVPLYPLTPDHFGTGPDHVIVNWEVDNHTESRHGIGGYLDDAETAKRIYDALTAG